MSNSTSFKQSTAAHTQRRTSLASINTAAPARLRPPMDIARRSPALRLWIRKKAVILARAVTLSRASLSRRRLSISPRSLRRCAPSVQQCIRTSVVITVIVAACWRRQGSRPLIGSSISTVHLRIEFLRHACLHDGHGQTCDSVSFILREMGGHMKNTALNLLRLYADRKSWNTPSSRASAYPYMHDFGERTA